MSGTPQAPAPWFKHIERCPFHEGSITKAAGVLGYFGGRMTCVCPSDHVRAEKKKIRDYYRAKADAAESVR